MYKLIYKNQFAAGFDADQIVGNLAQLLQLKPKTVRLVFLSSRPCVIKVVESAADVEQWRAAFLEAGVHLDAVSMAAPDADSIADQIELELELHSLDDDVDEDDEPPRQLLVKKIIVQEEPLDTIENSAPFTPAIDVVPVKDVVPAKDLAPAIDVAPSIKIVEPPQPQGEPSAKTQSATAQPIQKQSIQKQPTVVPLEILVPPETVVQPEILVPSETVVPPEIVATSDVVAVERIPLDTKNENVVPAKTTSPISIKTPPQISSVVEEIIPSSEPRKLEKKTTVDKAPDVKSTSTLDAKTNTNVEPANKPEAAVEIEGEPKIASKSELQSASDTTLDDKSEPEQDVKSDPGLAEEDTEKETAQDVGETDVDWHKSYFLWGMLAIVLAIALTASTILWLKRPLWLPTTVSAHTDKIVNALATDALFTLVHVDVPRLQQLPDVLQPDMGLNNLPAPEENFWRKLEQSGINIAQQLDQVWIAAYRTNNQTQSLWVLNGKFNVEQLRDWLKKNYVIDEDSPQQIVFSSVDENTCEKNPVKMVVIEPDRIVLGAPEQVAAFRGRLEAAAPAAKDLLDWQSISEKQMITVALFNPAQFSDASTAIALGKISVDVASVKGMYFGVAPRLLPPMLEFTAVMVGANQAFIDGAEKNIVPLLANVKNTIVQDWPETLPIYERMKLSKTEQQLRASVFFDEQLQAQLQLWVNSLLARTFAMNDSSAPVSEERFDEKPRVFNEVPSPQLADFASTKHLNGAVAAQTSAGPFGVGISNVEATAEGVVITLDVNAFNLPNLGKEADSIQLRITDIVDHQDQSLLATGGCDTTGVRRAAKIDMIYDGAFFDQGQLLPYVGIQGTKRILLPETISLSSIGAIKGELSYNLPLNIERVKIDAPLAGKVISTQGLQLRFLSASTSRLYFQHSGNSDVLLQINALNTDGKVLATTNAMRGPSFFAESNTTSMDVQGAIAAAEVVVASKLEKQIYPFSFGRIQPPEQVFAVAKPAPELLTATALAALKQDSPPIDVKYPYQSPQQTIVAGPALIAVNQMTVTARQLSLAADIYVRNQHPLTRQLSAARFFITEVEDSAGNIHSVNFQAPVALEYQGGTWTDGAYQIDPAQPWLRGQLDLRGQDLGVSDVVAFWGKLVFLAATDPIDIQLPFQFGMQWNGAESSFKLARWEAGRLLFDIHGSFPELMAITALDDNGAAVSQAAELRSSLGVNQVELPIQQRPATIEFKIARNQQTAEFPFEIRAQQ